MTIFIITMDDPVYTIPFIQKIIKYRHKDIVGLAVPDGDRMRIGKKRSRLVYLASLMLIMGVSHFIKFSLITLNFKIRKKLSHSFSAIKSPSVMTYAESKELAAKPGYGLSLRGTTPRQADRVHI